MNNNKPGNKSNTKKVAQNRELLKRLLKKEKQLTKKKLELKKRPENLDYLPLSFAQEALWFVDKLNPGSAGYNTLFSFRLKGKMDLSVVYRTLETLQQRHEVLRTSFVETGESKQNNVDGNEESDDNVYVMAVIHEKLNLPLTEIDVSQENELHKKLDNIIEKAITSPFDLAKAPLYRAILAKLDKQDYMLVLTVHHIISDGWTAGILSDEFWSIYKAYLKGREISLPPTLQYVDYAIAQRDYLTRDVLDKQLAYWKQQLSDISQLELPTDHTRLPKNNYQGISKTRMFSSPLSKAIRLLSMEHGITVFITMLSAMNVLMQRYSGQRDIVMGTPLVIRNTPELEKTIGLLINMVVLRMTVSDDTSLKDFFKINQKMLLEAYDNSDLPFDYLVKVLSPRRVTSVNPFFQVVFSQDMTYIPALQHQTSDDVTLTQADTSADKHENKMTRFDIEMYLKDDGRNLGIEFICNKQLFDDNTVQNMLGHYVSLLEQFVKQPEEPISTYSLLNYESRLKILNQWNQTRSAYPRHKTVAELFEEQVDLTPAATAIIYRQQSLTYEELNQKSNQLAHYLISCGVKAELMVGLCLERGLDLIISILAITKAGGVYVPLDAEYPLQRLSFMLEDVKGNILLTQSKLLDRFPGFSGHSICIDKQWPDIENEKLDNPCVDVSATNLIYVMYTSGSTGQPKGVCIEHKSVARLVRETNFIKIDAADTFLLLAPVSFDASTLEIWGSLLNGAKLVIYPEQKISLDRLGHVLQENAVSILWLTSVLFSQMVEQQLASFKGVKTLLAGGEVLSLTHVKNYLSFLQENSLLEHHLVNGYGPTENTTFSCCHVMDADTVLSTTVPIGKPISNTTVYILDENKNPVPPGINGELYIGGDGLARGYLNQHELTHEKFVDKAFDGGENLRLYRTGDLVRYTDEGNIVFIGRIDNQIKLRGYRIELGEIETLISGMEDISEALVMLREDDSGDKRLVAYLLLKNKENDDISAVREYCQNNLPSYMVPSAFVVLDSLPVNSNGKIDRKALPMPDDIRGSLSNVYTAPGTQVEQQLAAIWCRVLKLEQVGIHDDFFDMGGHSLMATQVVSRVREVLNVDLPVAEIFSFPTVAELAKKIEMVKWAASVNNIDQDTDENRQVGEI